MDGYGVLDALGRDDRTRTLPVLVLTARALPEEEDRASEAGARLFMTKPFEPSALAEALDRILEDPAGAR